ncbi:hypothetical protein ACGF07_31845 [Kitasatospora sp. NPDC048194]|uniref:hypothetical protein n=1 Tax=Kitasatospora sp. NPDC048194 TaxID=3364045 RepID=UPI00372430BA
MRPIIPGSTPRIESAPLFSATSVASIDEVQDLSIALGVDLFLFAADLIGESAEEKAARLDAARDMLADDPAGLYLGAQAANVRDEGVIIPLLVHASLRSTHTRRAAA